MNGCERNTDYPAAPFAFNLNAPLGPPRDELPAVTADILVRRRLSRGFSHGFCISPLHIRRSVFLKPDYLFSHERQRSQTVRCVRGGGGEKSEWRMADRGWQERKSRDMRERRDPEFEVLGSKFRKPRTSDLELLSVSLVPLVSLGYPAGAFSSYAHVPTIEVFACNMVFSQSAKTPLSLTDSHDEPS